MKKLIIPGFLLACIFFAECAIAQVADKNATAETKNLLQNLRRILSKGILFGHQDDLAYGVGWRYEPGKSDVKAVAGEYPALYGWDLSGLEKDSKTNIDSVPFDKMKQYIREGYKRGGVITISWHLDHPVTGKNAWDTTHGGVSAVLPGGSANLTYLAWLDKVAGFMLSLKGNNEELIPVLFRPFHELTGNWFWWTSNTCTPEEFIQLWQYTIGYLRDTKQVHNLLYVYNTASFNSRSQFLERYPGNDYVDVISFDDYQRGDPSKDNSFVKALDFKLNILDSVAAELGKLPALGETGYEAIPYPEWWTNTLWKAIAPHQLSYVLLWRNHGLQPNGHMHYYVPYEGQVSAADFKKFYELDKILFEKKARQQNLYNSP